MTLNEKLDSSMKIVKTKTLPPAEGERRAMRGYMGQYERAGAAIYAELERGQLEWIGVADRSAGIADDLVLGFNGLIVGHQFKTSRFPGVLEILCHSSNIQSKRNDTCPNPSISTKRLRHSSPVRH